MSRRLRHALPAFLAVFLALCLFAACGGGSQKRAGLTDRLLIVREYGIAEISFPSAEETQLGANSADRVLLEPTLSPDGTRIAYTAQLTLLPEPGQPSDFGGDLYVMDRDGSNARAVAQHQTRGERFVSPAWLSNGELLASDQRPEVNVLVATLMRFDLDAGTSEAVLENVLFVAPDRSRDGIVYVQLESSGNQSLWLANADGSEPRELLGPDQGYGIFQSPRVSPDGRYVAFGTPFGEPFPTSRRGPAATYVSRASLAGDRIDGLPQQILLLDVETGEAVQLGAGVLENLDSPSVSWTDDGRRLFVLETSGLYVVDVASRKAERIAGGTTHGQVEWIAAR